MRYLEENDLLPYWRQHTGHAIGLRNHEAPFLDVGDHTVLEPGMVFTIEPGLYDDAIPHLKKALGIKKSAKLYVMLGECYLNNSDNESAAVQFQKALKIDADNRAAREGYKEATGNDPP